jgi:hypothetical protein
VSVPIVLKTLFRIVLVLQSEEFCKLRVAAFTVIGREYPELALSFNAVGRKICVINGKNYRKKFTPRQIHERAIGKIHGSIPITRHQTMHVLQFRMFDCTEDQCSRTYEPPGGLRLRARIANQSWPL